MKIANIDREIPLNDLRNVNETFWKDVLMIILKVAENQDFLLSLEDTFLEKPQEGEGINLSTPPNPPNPPPRQPF